MFKKFVTFEIDKQDTVKVVDILSQYKSNIWGHSDLTVVSAEMENKNIYRVSVHCRSKDLSDFLADILALNREGVVFDRLYVK